MHYIFDVKDAEEYGLDEAVMLYNIRYWITLNKANNTNFYDGRTWTYNSITAFKELFPFWTENQIRRILKSLIDRHILITGNYNKVAYDRTLWYSFYDNSICEKIEMEFIENKNRIVGNDEPIPDINTDKKPNHKPNKKSKIDYEESFNIFYELYNYPFNKVQAQDEWKKIDIELHQDIYNHVREYRSRGQGVEFPFKPNNYLKRKRWTEGIEDFKNKATIKNEDSTIEDRLKEFIR